MSERYANVYFLFFLQNVILWLIELEAIFLICKMWFELHFVVSNIEFAVFAPNNLTSHFLNVLTTFVVNHDVTYEEQLVGMLQ